ncbi:uncharacterized protein LOC113075883 isoform X3 [Carassius auratus]|uniref:Uncharacterized protein LOC113075883 isoform X3 n=1 Tax=Carassius auratus TaxID=7957 RepID=A0A6P6N7B1_CARAU|nr:uncharacterized protein LOC113075883 isoform X3 [Carassius auratus]
MKAVNAVQLFSLFWTFTALCQADEDISVSCENVTGSVGEEVNLHCSVSLMCPCSIKKYKFQYLKDPAICTTESPKDSCKQSNILTCRYTPTTAITGKFSFFVQTTCGMNTTEFTVEITESFIFNETHVAESTNAVSMDAVITPVVGLSVIFIIIIILMAIISKKQSFGFQKRMCIKNDDGNSNCLEEVIYSNIDSAKPN